MKKAGLTGKRRTVLQRVIFAWFILVMLTMMLTNTAYAAKISQKKVTLLQYTSKKIKVNGVPAKQVTWTSSDPDVAAVKTNGTIKALGAGSCKIIGRYKKKQYICQVKVQPLKISRTELTMVRKRQAKLVLNNTKIKPVWSSSNTAVATVDPETGLIRARKAGKCMIQAAYKNTVLSCQLTVISATSEHLQSVYASNKENRGKILLAGSSSMDYWENAPQVFAPYAIINMAIEGTTVTQWLEWYEASIIRYKPAAVVLYAGSNDIGSGRRVTGRQNANNTIELLKRIKKKLKNTPIFYVSIVPCWARKGAWNEIAQSNKLVSKFCKKTSYVYYIDVASAIKNKDGTPDPVYFSDGLHPSAKGYAVWKKLVVKEVKKRATKAVKQK